MHNGKKIRIFYMLPDISLDGFSTWHQVSLKEFKEEWARNGLFEYVTSAYNHGDLCLYINRQIYFGDGKTKIRWGDRDKLK